MKRWIAVLFTLLVFGTFSSCRMKHYADDLDVDPILKHALGGRMDYTEPHDAYFDEYFKEPEWVRDSEVRIATIASNLDEVGIFRVEEGHTKEMRDILNDYLTKSLEKNREWYDSYMPEQTAKLRDAEVRVYGNYVTYAILNADARAEFFKNVEQTLRK